MPRDPTSTHHNHLRTQTVPPHPSKRDTKQRRRANTLSPKQVPLTVTPPSYTTHNANTSLPLTTSSRPNRNHQSPSPVPPAKRQKFEVVIDKGKKKPVATVTEGKAKATIPSNNDERHAGDTNLDALGISYDPPHNPSWSSFHPRANDEHTDNISLVLWPLFSDSKSRITSPSPRTRPRSNAIHETHGRHRVTRQYGSGCSGSINGSVVDGILINPFRNMSGIDPPEADEGGKGELPRTPTSERSLRAGVGKTIGRTIYEHATTPIPPRRVRAGSPRPPSDQLDTGNDSDVSSLDLDNDTDPICPPTPTLRQASRFTRERSPIPLTHQHLLHLTKSPHCSEPPFSSAREAGSLIFHPKRGVTVTPGHALLGGDTLIKTEPLYKVLHSGLLGSHCSGCFMSPEHKAMMDRPRRGVEDLRRRYLTCRCGVAIFCSVECYARTASEHADECRAFGYGLDVPGAEVRLVARVVFAMRGSSRNKPDWKRILPDYTMSQVHESEVHDLGRLVNKVMVFLKASRGDQDFQLEEYGISGRKELVSLIRRIRTMMFIVHDANTIPLGYCISPMVGRINHSCRPNAFVAFPFGTGVAKSMRVIALDPQYAEDEITISYVHLGTPCHQRTEVLAPFGFTHECVPCERDEANVDMRWSVRHRNCDRDGLVKLTDTDPTEGLRKAKCSGCARSSWAEVSDTPLKEIMEKVGDSIQAEMEGDWIVPKGSMSDEIPLLRREIDNLLEVFPDTFHPISLLQRRLTRFLIAQPNDENDLSHLILAIEYLDTASLALRDIHQDEPRPIIASMLMEKVEAHLKAVGVILDWEEKAGKEGGGKRGSDGKVWTGNGRGKLNGKGGRGVDERVELHLREAKEGLGIVGDDLKDLWGRGCEGCWQVRRAARAKREIGKLCERARGGSKGMGVVGVKQ